MLEERVIGFSDHRVALGRLAAGVWGFAEATLFFLVPDVVLTWIALEDTNNARQASIWSLVGALSGGTLMYLWGKYDSERAFAALEKVPAISQEMCDSVAGQLRTQGVKALFLGPASGTPYKIYAVCSGAMEIPYLAFLAVSIPARLLRFRLLIEATRVIRGALPASSLATRRRVHLACWAGFYAWYFSRFHRRD